MFLSHWYLFDNRNKIKKCGYAYKSQHSYSSNIHSNCKIVKISYCFFFMDVLLRDTKILD